MAETTKNYSIIFPKKAWQFIDIKEKFMESYDHQRPEGIKYFRYGAVYIRGSAGKFSV